MGNAVSAILNFIHPADSNAADNVRPDGEAELETDQEISTQDGKQRKGNESDEVSEESDYRKQSDEQLLKSKKSYEKLIKEHKKKLEDYKKDPYSYDND